MRKVLFSVVLIMLILAPSVRRQAFAYTITPADTVVSAYVNNVPTPTVSVTPTATPSGTLTPTPSVSPTPSGPTPTPIMGSRFSLFGYTSPAATVTVTNPGLYTDTVADRNGYFEFVNFFSKKIVEDICIMAQDQAGRVTMPVCIPPIPDAENNSVGPVMMPPTISLNSSSYYTGDTVIVTGQTTPQTDVQLSLFTDEAKSNLGFVPAWLNPIRPAYAASLPKQSAKVDRQGYFSVVVPSSDAFYYRTFAQTVKNKDFSLKSITLGFDIFPGWFLFMKVVLGLLASLKAHILEIIILSQIVLIFYLIIRRYLQPHTIARMRALAIMEHPLPVFTQHELLIREHEENLEKLMKEKEALNGILNR